MSKKYTDRLTSGQVADSFGIPYADMMEALSRLMSQGSIPRSRGRTINSALMDATLDLADITMLIAELDISPEQAFAAIEKWKAEAGTIRSASRSAVTPGSSNALAILQHVFGTKPAFVSAVRGAIEGTIDRETSWRRHGFVVEGALIIFAASHPFMTAILSAEQVSSRTFNDAVALLPDSERGYIKKLFSKNYRVAECNARSFLAAIEQKQATP